jgi:hypothetical protein
VPFHKLSQWLTYSLLEPIDTFLHWTIAGRTDQTGLPEYRNGGLLLDLGFLSLKTEAFSGEDWETSSRPGVIPRVEPGHQAVIEWRAVTVIALWVFRCPRSGSLVPSAAALTPIPCVPA